MKNNISPFYVGQDVVAVSTKYSVVLGVGVEKDKVYRVQGINFCCSWRVNVGGNKHDDIICCCGSCDQDLSGNVIWWPSEYFAPIQKESFPLMTFSKIVEKEKEEVLIPN